jgi:hypothetical protein
MPGVRSHRPGKKSLTQHPQQNTLATPKQARGLKMTNALTLDEIQTMPLADRWNISVKKIHDAAVAENIAVSDAWQRLFG